jgi:hypothetical protein
MFSVMVYRSGEEGRNGPVTSKFKGGTLPDHERCSVHRLHLLGCEQYERLLSRSGQQCEICRAPGTDSTRGKLRIDHFGYAWAVRGLLCNTCNTRLTSDAARRHAPWAAGYLADSWWIAECRRLGVPVAEAPEPGHGSAIRDQWNVTWLREGDGKWRPHGSGKPGISSATWTWLYEHRGPQNLAPFDLHGPEARALPNHPYLVWESERAMTQGFLAESGDAFAQSMNCLEFVDWLRRVVPRRGGLGTR